MEVNYGNVGQQLSLAMKKERGELFGTRRCTDGVSRNHMANLKAGSTVVDCQHINRISDSCVSSGNTNSRTNHNFCTKNYSNRIFADYHRLMDVNKLGGIFSSFNETDGGIIAP